MDFTLTQKEFRERLKETPEKLVGLMGSEEAENALEKVSEEYKIPPGQTQQLAFYVAHVFLGMLEPKEFRKAIQEDLKFGSENALHISEELEHRLFSKAKKELHDMYGLKTFNKGAHEQLQKDSDGSKVSKGSEAPTTIPPPLDLRKAQQQKQKPEPDSDQKDQEFPGEIVHHGTEEQKEEKTALEELSPPQPIKTQPPKEKELHKPEPLKRSTPAEKDSYLEPVEQGKEGKPKHMKEGRTVDLSKS